jgi:hypothetical protein
MGGGGYALFVLQTAPLHSPARPKEVRLQHSFQVRAGS